MFQFKQVDGDVHSVSFGAADIGSWSFSTNLVKIFFFKSTQHLNAKHLFDLLKLQTYDRWLNSEKGTKFEGFFLAANNNPLDMNLKLEVKLAVVGDETSGAYIHPSAVPHAVYWAAPQYCVAIHKMQRAIEDYCAGPPPPHVPEWTQEKEWEATTNKQKVAKLDEALKQDKNTVHKRLTSAISYALVNLADDNHRRELVHKLEKLDKQIYRGTYYCNAGKHTFCIMKLNAVSYWTYFLIECPTSKFHKKMQHIRHQYPKATLAYKQDLVPNAIEVITELKSDKRITYHEGFCTAPHYLAENKFFAIVTDICQCDNPIIPVDEPYDEVDNYEFV